jgi:hypothetical protein
MLLHIKNINNRKLYVITYKIDKIYSVTAFFYSLDITKAAVPNVFFDDL